MDYGSRYAEKRERVLDLRLQRVYREAQKDLEAQFSLFLKQHMEKGRDMWAKLSAGEIEPEEYHRWMRGQVFIGKKWKSRINTMTERLKTSNEAAMSIIRGEQYSVFAENANYESFNLEKDLHGGISFDIYDEAAVQRLIAEKPELMPRKVVNGRKDKAWNQGVISNAVAQAILQGESIDNLAKRLARDTARTDMKAMVRYARTAMTSAQNAGRIDTMHRSQEMGISVKKQWLATLDARTRDSHAALDGAIVEVDKKFANGLMYPGDPSGPAGEVYNCRCTLVYVYPEFADENASRRDNESGEVIEDMTYSEWKKKKVAAGATAGGKAVAYGSAVSGISKNYQKSVANSLNHAPKSIRDVWGKYQSALQEPLFDANDPEAAYFARYGDLRVHIGSEQKAYEKSTYQEENVCYFHEYGHNIDFLAGNNGYFSAQYQGGAFPKMIHEEIGETLRAHYLRSNPNADLWFEKDGFDLLVAQASQGGGDASQIIAQLMGNYWQVAKISMEKDEYKRIREEIYDAEKDQKKLRRIWEKHVITNPEVKKWFEQDKKSIVEAGKRTTYFNKNNAESFASWLEGSYNKYERGDVSDMYESLFYPTFSKTMQIGHANKTPGYWGNAKKINMENVAAEAFAEMFSATATGNASLPVIKKWFPKSYSIFEKMLEGMK